MCTPLWRRKIEAHLELSVSRRTRFSPVNELDVSRSGGARLRSGRERNAPAMGRLEFSLREK